MSQTLNSYQQKTKLKKYIRQHISCHDLVAVVRKLLKFLSTMLQRNQQPRDMCLTTSNRGCSCLLKNEIAVLFFHSSFRIPLFLTDRSQMLTFHNDQNMTEKL